MTEGWFKDDYLILFGESEIPAASQRYAISQWLPGYQVVGLRGWDDFIVRNAKGQAYSVPAVVPDVRRLSPLALPNNPIVLRRDERFTGKIKWYVKPILFGGSPEIGDNVVWVSHE